MIATHILTMNGKIHGELLDPMETPEGLIRTRIGLLDGTRRFSLGLWRLPGNTTLDRVDLSRSPQEYIQAAGSRERLTVEIRRIEDGVPRQYVIGRGGADEGDEFVPIAWDGSLSLVQTHEVFDASGAAEIFASYLSTATVPEVYGLRSLHL